RFAYRSQLVAADIDLERLVQDRLRQGTFSDSAWTHRDAVAAFRTVPFRLEAPARGFLPLKRTLERFPYVPADPSRRD
ncbi:NAD(+) synthase, partial [Pelomicrobium sp. G1]